MLLHKGLYGLKQSGKLWNDELKRALLTEGFTQSHNDQEVFISPDKDTLAFVIVYVYDLILATNSPSKRKSVEDTLARHYKTKLLG